MNHEDVKKLNGASMARIFSMAGGRLGLETWDAETLRMRMKCEYDEKTRIKFTSRTVTFSCMLCGVVFGIYLPRE